MQVGARTALWSGGGKWVNPYITDGLIAMWDGEWNVGGGTHDETATIWKDIVGGVEASPNNGTAIWTGLSARIPTTADYFNLPLSFGQKVIDTMVEGGFTCEVVFAQYPAKTNQGVVAVIGSKFNNAYFALGLNNHINGYKIADICEYSMYWVNNYYDITAPRHFAYTSNQYYGNAEIGHYAIFDKLYENLKFQSWYGVRTRKQFETDVPASVYIGKGGPSASSFVGEIHCVRFYNRELGENEIAANYAIDKARFGLT